jgi:hypothetical protein
MRRLGQPEVLKSASLAALITALLCYPRLSLWSHRPDPLWYLEAIIFLGTIVLWGFVFAWHTAYSSCPVFTIRGDARLWGLATLSAILVAAILFLFLDPSLRPTAPLNYPVNFQQWLAMVLFDLAFMQLFLVFAPFAWLIRLFQNRSLAVLLTVLFGVVVLGLKARSMATPYPLDLFAALVALRIVLGFLSVFFYLRGGMILVWWWIIVMDARHLLTLGSGS